MPHPVGYMSANYVDVLSWYKCVSSDRLKAYTRAHISQYISSGPLPEPHGPPPRTGGRSTHPSRRQYTRECSPCRQSPRGCHDDKTTSRHWLCGAYFMHDPLFDDIIIQLPLHERFRPIPRLFFTPQRFCILWRTSRLL
jgi:hypothetical protein